MCAVLQGIPQYKQGQAGQHGDDNDYDGFCSVHHSKNLPSSLPVVIIASRHHHHHRHHHSKNPPPDFLWFPQAVMSSPSIQESLELNLGEE